MLKPFFYILKMDQTGSKINLEYIYSQQGFLWSWKNKDWNLIRINQDKNGLFSFSDSNTNDGEARFHPGTLHSWEWYLQTHWFVMKTNVSGCKKMLSWLRIETTGFSWIQVFDPWTELGQKFCWHAFASAWSADRCQVQQILLNLKYILDLEHKISDFLT